MFGRSSQVHISHKWFFRCRTTGSLRFGMKHFYVFRQNIRERFEASTLVFSSFFSFLSRCLRPNHPMEHEYGAGMASHSALVGRLMILQKVLIPASFASQYYRNRASKVDLFLSLPYTRASFLVHAFMSHIRPECATDHQLALEACRIFLLINAV